MKNLILASTSIYRKELLERLGHPFECISPNVDEDVFKEKINDPVELAEVLGLEKAKSVYQQNKSSIIIGSDQVAECEGKILGKPKTMEKAIEQLTFLKGKEHRLITSFTIAYNDKFITKTNITKLKMRDLTQVQIKNYLSFDKPFDCAGGYKLELKGISLFNYILTDDHSAIVGLPLLEVANVLNELGIMIPPENEL